MVDPVWVPSQFQREPFLLLAVPGAPVVQPLPVRDHRQSWDRRRAWQPLRSR